MKKLVYILSLILLGACSGPFQSSWNNFRAYYNTHYNAKKSFRAGLKQIERQPVTIDPDGPARVHREPDEAGKEYFAETIDREARLLRKFPDSKWADDALFLIGKSYYYRKEFYLALQKFEELYALNPGPELSQQSVIWKGRTLLDLGRHQDAIIYLEAELAVSDAPWNATLKAEAQVLLAEHYARVENWKSAATCLNNSFHYISDKSFLGRAFFLYGQALEHLEQYDQALEAFGQVSAHFPDYEYVYRANMKKGQMARKEGNMDLALSVFTSMKNDDKNFDRQSELNYEIARTQELRGYIDTAVQIYNRMLHPGAGPLARDLQARVYYRLGDIYREHYQNYRTAAAYYDSSSGQVANVRLVSKDVDIEVLSKAYNRYASLREEADKIDSLLWLGSLSAAKLDSVIEEKRKKRTSELQQQTGNSGNSAGERLANVSQIDRSIPESEGITSQYGFLNYRNQNLVTDARQKFRAVWGGRPLADNWRRAEAVAPMNSYAMRNEREATPKLNRSGDISRHDRSLNIDLSVIPATEKQKLELERQRTEVRYELGSLFFLALDLPDSASVYFRQVITDRPGGELEAQSMYSLFELHYLSGEKDSSAFWGGRVLKYYPNTEYAERVKQRLGTFQGF